MELKILLLFAFISVAVVVSDAGLPPEEYWNSVLPNTRMPKAVQHLLHPNSGRVNVNNNNHTHVNVGDTLITHNGNAKPDFCGSISNFDYEFNYGGGGGGSSGGDSGGGDSGGCGCGDDTDSQLHDEPNFTLFFLEKDLYAGNKMILHNCRDTNEATFLPRQVADSIPFSLNKLPEIYSKFSIRPYSNEAETIKKTIQECEENAIKGEEKFCATSLESMIDFTTSKLGKDVDAVSTEADSVERKVYRIERMTRKKGWSEKAVVVCHKQEYAYAVFYCHKTETTVAYGVSLVGEGGSKAEAVAVCHRDTAEWNPKHLAFQVLKVKPGTVPVCHYLPEDHIVWVPKN